MEYIEWLKEHCPEKMVSAEYAISRIRKGSRIFLGSACGEPQHLIRTMVKDKFLQDIMIYQMLSNTLAEFVDDEAFLRNFSLKLFFISAAMRKAAFEGKIDYVPAYLSQIPGLFASRRIGIDVALIQISPPDEFGYGSLGVSVDVTRSGMQNAAMVIAQVNPNMPRTMGDTLVHMDEIDYLVAYEEQLIEVMPIAKNKEIDRRIGLYVSQLVDHGATLQIGFGHLPNAILHYLKNKKDLGIHTQMVTDAFIPLLENKVITNSKKTLMPGKVVASLSMGSKKLYKYLHNNPMFFFRSSEYVNDPSIIAQNDNMVSISSALEVDLTGQVCNDSVGYMFYSGIGDQVDFLRGSAMSKGGFSIIALPSTAQDGQVSRIVPHLSKGAGVATTRGDIHFVVTEYGIAELQGKSIYQRVMELAQIAHPKFREDLIDVAKKQHYIFSDQLPPSRDDLLFLEAYRSTLKLSDGKTAGIRPLFPSDEFEYRNFYYSLKEESIYFRFFYRRRIFSHEMAQDQWAGVDYHKNMSLIAQTQVGGYKEIIAIGSYADSGDGYADIAFVVREDYHDQGIASFLLEKLESIAKENNFIGFMAHVLHKNTAMMRVFIKHYPQAVITPANGNTDEIRMKFVDDVENTKDPKKVTAKAEAEGEKN